MDVTTKPALASRTILTCLLAMVAAFAGYLADGLSPVAALTAAGFAAVAGYFRLVAGGPITPGTTSSWDLTPLLVLAELERAGSATVAELAVATGGEAARVNAIIGCLLADLCIGRESEHRLAIRGPGRELLQLMRPPGHSLTSSPQGSS